MFSSIYDYRFFNQSSLSPIVIDGGIMPLRPAADKRIVRGEDVAFITECEAERCNWWKSATYEIKTGSTRTVNNDAYTKRDFTKSISKNQIGLNEFQYRYCSKFGNLSTPYTCRLFSKYPTNYAICDYGGGHYSPDDAYRDTIFARGNVLSIADYESQSMPTGYPLTKQYIQGRFNNISKAAAEIHPRLYGVMDNSLLPYSAYVEPGGTFRDPGALWTIQTESNMMYLGYREPDHFLRIEIERSCYDLFDVAELLAIGVYAINDYSPGGEEILKSVLLPISYGTLSSSSDGIFLDFDLSIPIDRVKNLATACGRTPSKTSHLCTYEFFCEYSVLIRYSDRTKWP